MLSCFTTDGNVKLDLSPGVAALHLSSHFISDESTQSSGRQSLFLLHRTLAGKAARRSRREARSEHRTLVDAAAAIDAFERGGGASHGVDAAAMVLARAGLGSGSV
eukprot:TRINITY_DN299_c0_g2_i1.p4 TRINITY_DN299_c0_g2~~TRINITY_DN299_c0_g2_i1.p4  ORF type:complete len:106 (+),score=1.24 TRINITY_DN299_c0_g2_i1:1191-1508(+)